MLPAMGKARLTLFRSEISQLALGNLHYRSRKAIQVLVIVYVGLTLAETVLLSVSGMSVFDAVCHSFATIATGGFSTRNLSVAAYNSPLIEAIITVFMILSGMHFGLLFLVLTFKPGAIFRSEITRYYLISMSIGIVIVTAVLWLANDYTFPSAFRLAAFQVASLATTTGFASADSSVWHPLAIILLLFFTFQCACAGSTSGGLKADRVYLFFKSIHGHFVRILHPNAIYYTRLQGEVVQNETISNIYFFILLYLLIFFFTGIMLIAMGVDMLASFSGSATAIGNVGPGFSVVGSMGNFSSIPDAGKWLLSMNMLFGRLEIFALFLLFNRQMWKS
jgi:trk system potassium uptake protein TrkH